MSPTKGDWQLYPGDPLYVWDGKDSTVSLAMMTASEADSKYIVFWYKYGDAIINYLERAVEAVKKTDELKSQVEQVQNDLRESREFLNKVFNLLDSYFNNSDLFVQQRSRSELEELLRKDRESTR